MIQDAAHADLEYQASMVHLKIERHRLDRWGEVTGLNGQTGAARYERQMKHNAPLVVATLSQIKIVLKDLRRSEVAFEEFSDNPRVKTTDSISATRVSDLAEPNAPAVVTDTSIAWNDAQGLQHGTLDKKPNLLKRSLAAAKKPVEQPRRLKWVLHDRLKVDKGLARVTNLIDYLYELLNQDQLAMLLESTENFKLSLLQLSTNVSEMKALLQGGQNQSCGDTTVSLSSSFDGSTLIAGEDTASLSDDWKSGVTASRTTAFWKVATQFSIAMILKYNQAQPSHELAESQVAQLSFGDIIEPELRTAITMGDYGEGWVEWRRFETELGISRSGHVESCVPNITRDRVEKLVALLREPNKPTEFCVPPCLGYFLDLNNKRFGLVFKPPIIRSAPRPQSLLSCFGTRRVSLRAKIDMAQGLSQWLLYLHAVNWLHKGLRSANVLFFPVTNTKDLGKPFVSGFEYSRNTKSVTTGGPAADDIERAMYTHPSYNGAERNLGFKKTYDMYSLGIVLIEIALWLPINEILGFELPNVSDATMIDAATGGAEMYDDGTTSEKVSNKTAGRPSTLTAGQVACFRKRILEGPVLEQVAERVGDAFAAATRVCIKGMEGLGLDEKLDQTDGSVAMLIQQSFIENVVNVLKKISV